MSEEIQEKKARNRYPDRFSVEPPNLEKIGKLLEQLCSAVPGCEANRKDILNWIVEKCSDQLSASDLKELSDRFYDEERFLKLALEQVRAAKARGEKLTLAEIVGRQEQATVPARRARPRRKMTGDALETTGEELEVSS